MTLHNRRPDSPLLDHCPPTLPARAYKDAGWHEAELRAILRRNWVWVGRGADVLPGTVRRSAVGGAPVILVNDGTLRAFHNLCRHRGAELCAADGPLGRLVSCPYHAWAYAPDGRLVSTAVGTTTPDFQREEHGRLSLKLRLWNGFVFLSAHESATHFAADADLAGFDNWPMASLVTGHRLEKRLGCNWKVFWENYNECLHCPGIHAGFSDLVPVYSVGVMAESERSDPGTPLDAFRPGAGTWTTGGQPCGPEFPDLTEEKRAEGFRFLTIYPSVFVVTHVDYVRSVRLRPLGPTATLLCVDWLFSPGTLAQPGFDPARPETFGAMDRSRFGLKPIGMEVRQGFVFIRFAPGPQPPVAGIMAPFADDFDAYRAANLLGTAPEGWRSTLAVNRKSVRDVDNEGYHVAMAHPGLQDLYGPTYRDDIRAGGQTFSVGVFGDRPGRLWPVRHYLKVAPGNPDLPDRLQQAWTYYGLFPNAVIAFTPEGAQFYQEVPLDPGRTELRGRLYRRPLEDRRTRAARHLAPRIARETGAENRQISSWSNASMLSSAFEGVHLSDLEWSLRNHHDQLRSPRRRPRTALPP